MDELDVPAAVSRTSAVLARQLTDDSQWQLLVLEFALQAGRDAALGGVYARQRRALRATLAELLSQQAQRWHLALRTDADTAATMLLAMLYRLAVEHAADPAWVDEGAMTEAITATLNRVWL